MDIFLVFFFSKLQKQFPWNLPHPSGRTLFSRPVSGSLGQLLCRALSITWASAGLKDQQTRPAVGGLAGTQRQGSGPARFRALVFTARPPSTPQGTWAVIALPSGEEVHPEQETAFLSHTAGKGRRQEALGQGCWPSGLSLRGCCPDAEARWAQSTAPAPALAGRSLPGPSPSLRTVFLACIRTPPVTTRFGNTWTSPICPGSVSTVARGGLCVSR